MRLRDFSRLEIYRCWRLIWGPRTRPRSADQAPCEAGLEGRWSCEPILGSKAIHAPELVEVTCCDNQALTAGVTGDLKVVCADLQTGAFEVGSDFRSMS